MVDEDELDIARFNRFLKKEMPFAPKLTKESFEEFKVKSAEIKANLTQEEKDQMSKHIANGVFDDL